MGIQSDGGYIEDKRLLPITELVFKQDPASPGEANTTLGPLLCMETVSIYHLQRLSCS